MPASSDYPQAASSQAGRRDFFFLDAVHPESLRWGRIIGYGLWGN
ncbi:hypothetical protein ABI_11330 [Asticcacaulis biprosthecium C19]|uniref:Uncharacterized protein n=1 Tax=Asticcacaulis biprosthecium C19 TaxID=715226 RepID=F4QHF9_9CAUL|nr:hypothetical protein ABI_11330 [Asticcacaulis biprosthecium C19]